MSDNSQKQELIKIVDRLSAEKVAQLLEYAMDLQATGKRDRESVLQAIGRTRGKYKDVLSPSDHFAARRVAERLMENL